MDVEVETLAASDSRCQRLQENSIMFYFVLLLLSLTLTAAALFFFIRSNELSSRLRQAAEEWRQKEEAYSSELDKLEKIRHIPDIIERARGSKEQVEAKLAEAQRRADEILARAVMDAQDRGRKLRGEAEPRLTELRAERQRHLSEAETALKVAKSQAQTVLDESQKEARIEQVVVGMTRCSTMGWVGPRTSPGSTPGGDTEVGAGAASVVEDGQGIPAVVGVRPVARLGGRGGEPAVQVPGGDAVQGDLQIAIEESREVELVGHAPCAQQQIEPFDDHQRRAGRHDHRARLGIHRGVVEGREDPPAGIPKAAQVSPKGIGVEGVRGASPREPVSGERGTGQVVAIHGDHHGPWDTRCDVRSDCALTRAGDADDGDQPRGRPSFPQGIEDRGRFRPGPARHSRPLEGVIEPPP
jgi:hypothetical protein